MDWNSMILFGFATVFFMVAYLADVYTTMKGLVQGGHEGNFITRWLFSKIGQVPTAWALGVIVLFVGTFFASKGFEYGSAYFGLVGAAEAVQAFLNYRKLKK